ncbi:MAG: ATP-binding protein [Cellvibrionaceae bacterium]|nr:ATP-binding protein [Cellvibrionaceae bacterium]
MRYYGSALSFLALAVSPAVANVDAAFIADSSWLPRILLGTCALQALVIIYLLLRYLRRQPETRDLDPLLQKTKFQLHREIARHEATEELLLETRDYLSCLINSLPTVIIGVTEEGYVTHWNIAAEEITGLSSQNALGQKISGVYNAPPIPQEQIRATIGKGIAYTRDAIPFGLGADLRYLDLTIQPLVSPDTLGAVVLVQDVTLRVRMERSLIQNEKMLSLGVMAAGLAHEINNPLAAIMSNLQTINRRLSPGLAANIEAADALKIPFHDLVQYMEAREIPRFLDGIQQAGERAAKIVKTMLEFSHAHNSEFSQQNLAQLVDESLELATNTFELKTDGKARMPFIIRDFDPNLPEVECSASEIQQVLLNLLLNAAQAFQLAGESEATPTINIRLVTDRDHVILEVEDNGPGMSDKVQKHIFEPFFTTKGVGVGTGLGLSVSYFIIKEHHQGSIEVESKPGTGTRFTIRLPVHRHCQPPLRAG